MRYFLKSCKNCRSVWGFAAKLPLASGGVVVYCLQKSGLGLTK